jgi:hypothetical protein
VVGFGIAFSPLVPDWVIWAALAVAGVIALLLFVTRTRGAAIRTVAMALLVLALANPSLTREDRDPLTSVAVVVVDKSPSQTFGDRAAQTESAREALASRGSSCAWSRPARRTARPMAHGSFMRSAPRSPTCRPSASPAPS